MPQQAPALASLSLEWQTMPRQMDKLLAKLALVAESWIDWQEPLTRHLAFALFTFPQQRCPSFPPL